MEQGIWGEHDRKQWVVAGTTKKSRRLFVIVQISFSGQYFTRHLMAFLADFLTGIDEARFGVTDSGGGVGLVTTMRCLLS